MTVFAVSLSVAAEHQAKTAWCCRAQPLLFIDRPEISISIGGAAACFIHFGGCAWKK